MMNYMFLAKKLSNEILEFHTDDEVTVNDLQQLMCLDTYREPVSMSDYTDDDWMNGESLSERLDDPLNGCINTMSVLTPKDYADIREMYTGYINILHAATLDHNLFTRRFKDICDNAIKKCNTRVIDHATSALINEMTGEGRGLTIYYGF